MGRTPSMESSAPSTPGAIRDEQLAALLLRPGPFLTVYLTTEPAFASIRAALDTQFIKETQKLNRYMVVLTIAISSGAMKVKASPVAAARPVRPMRCT